jgi:ferredoxin--NADP+ reductase
MHTERVIAVEHLTDSLFAFRTTRDSTFTFESGQFTMIGQTVGSKKVLRAYSMVSPTWADYLEFLSIKVPDGELTSRLQHIEPGDEIIVNKKSTGSLLLDNLTDGRNLYLFATGTGIAPFLSIVQDPEVYDRYDHVVLVHGVREARELAYRQFLEEHLPNHEHLGEYAREQLVYVTTVTREPFQRTKRVTTMIYDGELAEATGLPTLDRERDRVMICGNPDMVHELRHYFLEQGWEMGTTHGKGQFVIENAFVEK